MALKLCNWCKKDGILPTVPPACPIAYIQKALALSVNSIFQYQLPNTAKKV